MLFVISSSEVLELHFNSHPSANLSAGGWELDMHMQRFACLAQGLGCWGPVEKSHLDLHNAARVWQGPSDRPWYQIEIFLPAALHLTQRLGQASITPGHCYSCSRWSSLLVHKSIQHGLVQFPTHKPILVRFPFIPEKWHLTSHSLSFLIWNLSWSPVESVS